MRRCPAAAGVQLPSASASASGCARAARRRSRRAPARPRQRHPAVATSTAAGSAPCSGEPASATATRDELVAQRRRGGVHRRADHRRAGGADRGGDVRQVGVAELEADARRAARRARRRRPASSRSPRRCRTPGVPACTTALPSAYRRARARCGSGMNSGDGVGRRPPCRMPISQSPSRGERGAGSRSGQPKRSAPRRRHSAQPVAGPGVAAAGRRRRGCAAAARRGSSPSCVRELVHRALQREHARRLARAAGERRRHRVAADEPVDALVVRAGVELRRCRQSTGSAQSSKGEVSESLWWRIAVSRPSRGRAERDALLLLLAVPVGGEHLRAGEGEPTGRPTCRAAIAASVTCGQTIALHAEAAADEVRDHAHLRRAAGRAGAATVSWRRRGCPSSSRTSVSRSPSQTAVVVGGSSGLWWLAAKR